MSLRIEPLPRMAGHLPFMRGRLVTMNDVEAGMVAAFGVPFAGDGRTDLAPVAMRETSAYFGSHFNANMKSAMDIDQRQALRGADMAGLIVDLGDLRPDGATGFEGPIRQAVADIRKRGAIALLLGGDEACIASACAGLRDSEASSGGIAAILIGTVPELLALEGQDLACVVSSGGPTAGDARVLQLAFHELQQAPERAAGSLLRHVGTRPIHVALDASAIASHWHGASPAATFDGLSLSQCRFLFRQLGAGQIASLSITGLDPAINGLSTVKTGQRLLLTAILDLIYARLGVLEPVREPSHA